MDVEFKNILWGDQGWQALKPGGPARLRAPGREPHTQASGPHSCTCWGKHLNENNVKFHSYLMSSDLTGPRGKDRSKMIVLDKFLKAKKSNRQTLQKQRLRNGKKKKNPLLKLRLVVRPAQRQPQPWALACLFVYLCIYLFVHRLCTSLAVLAVLYLIHTEIKFHLNSSRTWEEKVYCGGRNRR